MSEPLLEARGLDISYRHRRGHDDRIVRDVSFTIELGEVLALVGESGSGKTTVARAVAGLVRADGELLFGAERTRLGMRRPHAVRRRIQMVFQDPRSSLNPRMTVAQILAEAWRTHPDAAPAGDRRRASIDVLERVGLTEAVLDRRPRSLSGGQCQRVSIARAVALRPQLLVCDEAVSALDVSVQAQIVNLLYTLQRDLGVSYLFITHDLTLVENFADRVALMYLGEIVETGSAEQVWRNPQHDFTKALIKAIPIPDPKLRSA